MNKTLKISLISLGLIGAGLGIYVLLKRRKGSNGNNTVTYDNNIFDRVLNRYQNNSFPLKLNSGGNRVKALQVFLNESSGYGLDTDGKFGPLTLNAVKNEQSPFGEFKKSFPNAVFGEVSEEYYNLFIKNYENSPTSTSSNINDNSITEVIPTGGGYSGQMYAIEPFLTFNSSKWN